MVQSRPIADNAGNFHAKVAKAETHGPIMSADNLGRPSMWPVCLDLKSANELLRNVYNVRCD